MENKATARMNEMIKKYFAEINFKYNVDEEDNAIYFRMGSGDFVTNVTVAIISGDFLRISCKLNLGIEDNEKIFNAIIGCNICNKIAKVGTFYYSMKLGDLMFVSALFFGESIYSYEDVKMFFNDSFKLVENYNDQIHKFSTTNMTLAEFEEIIDRLNA